MTTDYQIQPNARRCAISGRELVPGDRYFSVLVEDAGRFVRKDFASDVWQGPPADAFSFWAGRVAAPEARKRTPPIDDDVLLDCFLRLEDQHEAARLRFRYVLALLLMRRRRFRFESSATEGGREILKLRCVKTGTQHQVVNPGLTDDEMTAVQEDVFRALGWE